MTGKHAAKFKPHWHIGMTGHLMMAVSYMSAAFIFHGHANELMMAAYASSGAIEWHEERHHNKHSPSHES